MQVKPEFLHKNRTSAKKQAQMQQLLKGLHMNFKHFDDIKPNDKAQFEMLYFSAQRALRRLELKLNRIYNGKTPKHLRIELKQLNRKLTQMAGTWKNIYSPCIYIEFFIFIMNEKEYV